MDCESLTVEELKGLCKIKGKRGYSRLRKAGLIELCCKEGTTPDRDVKAIEEERAERARQARLDELRREEAVSRRVRAESSTIQPGEPGRVKKKRDYKGRRAEWQLDEIERLSRRKTPLFMRDPQYLGYKKLSCPEDYTVLAGWMERGFVNEEKAKMKANERIDVSNLRISKAGTVTGDAEIIDRGEYEFMAINSRVEPFEAMKKKLERFRGLKGGKKPTHCFTYGESDSGKLYGIFLKR